MTWDDFANLTTPQKNKLAQFAALGNSLGGLFPSANPDISAFTFQQAKEAERFMREVNSLIGPAIVGIKHVQRKSREAALAAHEAANP